MEMIMTRLVVLALVALSLGTAAVNADPLKDAIRYQQTITTGGLWDAR
jgi:hypothetical protein